MSARLITMFRQAFCCALVLLGFVTLNPAWAQSSEGTDFWLTFTPNIGFTDLGLGISSKTGATVTVTATPSKASTAATFTQTFTLAANESQLVTFPTTLKLETPENYLIDRTAIHVVATAPISVVGRNLSGFTSDTYLGLPKAALGTEYRLIAYRNTGSYLPHAKVVATENDTSVTFFPAERGKLGDGSKIPLGGSRTLTLQQGETALFLTDGDNPETETLEIAGGRIVSNKPIAVLAGNACANVPVNNSYCDHLVEMLPPVTALGQNYLLVPTKRGITGDIVRIVAVADDTAIYRDGVLRNTLSKGEIHEFLVDTPTDLRLNRPALVAQFLRSTTASGVGDPAEMLVIPTAQFMTSYIVASTFGDASSNRFTQNYLNVVIPSGALSTFKLDGAAVAANQFFAIPGTNFSWAQLAVQRGAHRAEAALPFGMYAYGLGQTESYAQPAGMQVRTIYDTSDPFVPNARVVQVGNELRGLATDSSDTNANGLLDPDEQMWGAAIGPRSEDTNMNNQLDAGEDRDGNGRIDRDLGLKSIEFATGSSNLVLEVATFTPGDGALPFVVRRIDPAKDGLATLFVTDLAGNTLSVPIALVNSTTIKNVRVREVLSRSNIVLDFTSFATAPAQLQEFADRYEIEWFYPAASTLSDIDLGYDVTFKSPVAGETRVVSRELTLEYEDSAGSVVRYAVGPKAVQVLLTAMDIAASINKSEYLVGENGTLTIDLKNIGPATVFGFPICARLVDGNGVDALPPFTISAPGLASGGSTSVTRALTLTSYVIGQYQVRLEAYTAACGIGPVLKAFVLPFTIVDQPGFVAFDTSLKLDKAFYQASDRVLVDTVVRNLHPQNILDGYSVRVQIVRPDGTSPVPQSRAVPTLVPAGDWRPTFTFALQNEAPGVYTALLQLLGAGGAIVQTRSTSFVVQSAASSGFGLSGTVSVDPREVLAGDVAHLNFTVRNQGNADLNGMALLLRVVNPQSQQVVQQWTVTTNLPQGQQQTLSRTWDASGVPAGNYVAVLSAAVDAREITLGQDNVRISVLEPFSFTPQTGVSPNILVTSNTVGINGLAVPFPIGIVGGEYSVNGGAYRTTPSTVSDGDTVTVRVTSAVAGDAKVVATLTVGSKSAAFEVTTRNDDDLSPDPFTFAPQSGVPLNLLIPSNAVTIAGINTATPVSVAGGEYSLNGGAFTAAAGTLRVGDTLALRVRSSTSFATATSMNVTVGTYSTPFSVTTEAADITPDPFTFPAKTGVTLDTLISSNTVTISGINTSVPVTVTGGEYSLNGGAFTAADGTVKAGDTLTVRKRSSMSPSTSTSMSVQVGGYGTSFSVTTVDADVTPDPFTFPTQENVELDTLIVSNTITIAGINKPVSIKVTGGEYRVNNGAFTAADGTVKEGDTVTLRVRSASTYDKDVSMTLMVSAYGTGFTVKTKQAPLPGVAHSFTRDARVLVLAACDSAGPAGANCETTRKAFLETYLSQLGIEHKVVTSGEAFKAEFRCGRYNTYWLSGKIEKLMDTLVPEVLAAVFRGDALLLDGEHDNRNGGLEEALGVKFRGKPNNLPNTVVLASSYLPSGTFTIAGDAMRVELGTATRQAHLGSTSDEPAIVANAYGQGQAMQFAFDLTGTLYANSSNPLLRSLVEQTLGHVAPIPSQTVTADAYVALTTQVKNTAALTQEYELAATLPAGMTFMSSIPDATVNGNALKWRLTIPAGDTTLIDWAVRAPASGGSFTVPVTISRVDGANLVNVGNSSFSVTVNTSATAIGQTVAALQAMNLSNGGQRTARDKAVANLQTAQSKLAQSQFETAIGEYVSALGELDKITSVSTVSVETAIARLMQEAGRQNCGVSTVCGVSNVAPTGYSITVFGSANLSNGEAYGSIGAGGAMSLSSYTAASRIQGDGARVVAGGSLTWSNGSVGQGGSGVIRAGGVASVGQNVGRADLKTGVTVDDWNAMKTEYQTLTDSMAAKPGQAATSLGSGQFRCAGTDTAWNVCTITATQLTQARAIDLQYPNTASVLVNVTGGAATLSNGQMTWNGQPLLGHAAAKQVILNFPGTGAISVSSFGLGGTFLAPRASLNHSNGAIDGAIVVNTLSSTGSYRCSAFSGVVQ